jgi:hypothetical protein
MLIKAPHPDNCGCEVCLSPSPPIEFTSDQLARVKEASEGQSGGDALRLSTIGLDIVDTLLRKNHDYGCSAWRVPVLAPGMTPRQAIQCRMSDKISRLNTLLSGDVEAKVKESIEDTMKDLAGYAILWLGAESGE